MKDARTLFEKLRCSDPGAASLQRFCIQESILLNLRRVLNTRRGNAPAAPEYGVIDLSAILHNYPESIGEMAESIRRCIERYEPRLSHVRVMYEKNEEDALTLRFRISAQIVLPGIDGPVSFDTLVTSSGRVQVGR